MIAKKKAKKVDWNDDQTIAWIGESAPGSATSEAVWRIKRVTFTGDESDSTTEWANGSGDFTQIWDDHLSLTYV